MSKPETWKHVFCLEGLWDEDLRSTLSVKPGLDLLQTNGMKYIYKDAATESEFNFYLRKYRQKRYNSYPVLYLGFHGTENAIELSDNKELEVQDIANTLEGACKNRVVIFASCSTFKNSENTIKDFIAKTDALAVIGYQSDVDWFEATAFEIMLLDILYHNAFDGRGVKGIEKRFSELEKKFPKLKAKLIANKKEKNDNSAIQHS